MRLRSKAPKPEFGGSKSPRELQQPEMAGLLKRMQEKREASEQGSKTRIWRPKSPRELQEPEMASLLKRM